MASNPQSAQRKLSAILLADVVSYSRMMGENETRTLENLKTHLQDLITPTITAFHGHIIKLMGDGILAEFPSVVEAVSAAVLIQQEMARRNAEIPENEQIILRIGINLGDVIAEADDIFGDGVNIAARLEAIADPGCVCISGIVHEALGNKLPLDFEYLGEQQVKNITQPVRAYRATLRQGATLEIPAQSSSRPNGMRWWPLIALLAIIIATGVAVWFKPMNDTETNTGNDSIHQLLERPSIAVLPFVNRSGDPEQEYFSDGISEDIITDLSRLKNLAVIARNSSFTFKGSSASAAEVGEDLDVRYILEGSVRRSGDRLRITAQLIDSQSGHQLWAERYDRKLTDVFAVQDEITSEIVNALSVKLSGDEQKQLHNIAGNFEAYDVYLKARAAATRLSEEDLTRANELFEEAISLDPGFARAYGSLGVNLTRAAFYGYTDSPVEDRSRALELAEKAVAIDPGSPQTLWSLSYVYMTQKRFEEAIEVLEKAIAIAPNYADGYGLLALINNNLGRADKVIPLIEKGMELNPLYTFDYPYNLGRAYYAMGDYETAVKNLEKAIERNEAHAQTRMYLAASYMELGRKDDAEWQVTELEVRYPGMTLSSLWDLQPLADEGIRQRLTVDLRKAGMAE